MERNEDGFVPYQKGQIFRTNWLESRILIDEGDKNPSQSDLQGKEDTRAGGGGQRQITNRSN